MECTIRVCGRSSVYKRYGNQKKIRSRYKLKVNLVFTIPECLQNSIKWSLPVKRSFYLYLIYYSGNMFRLASESSSGPYIKIQILNFTLNVLWDPKHLHALY
jgi:hypothetical protein